MQCIMKPFILFRYTQIGYMPCNQPLESYPPPDRRKSPRISSDFLKRKGKQIMRKSTVINKFISSQVDLVSKSNIIEMINELTSFHNRHTKSQYINSVAEWITNKLKEFGYDDDGNDTVYYHSDTDISSNLDMNLLTSTTRM